MSLSYTKPARLRCCSRRRQWRAPVPPDRGTADRDMKIATIEVIVVGIPFAGGGKSAESAWGEKNASSADSLLVKVTTEGGIVGWGEAFGFTAIPAVKAAIEEVIAPLCIGVSALSIGSLMLDIQKRLHIFGRSGAIMFGISAIDIALWDILGKATGQPVPDYWVVLQCPSWLVMQVSFATLSRGFSSRTSIELWPMASPM